MSLIINNTISLFFSIFFLFHFSFILLVLHNLYYYLVVTFFSFLLDPYYIGVQLFSCFVFFVDNSSFFVFNAKSCAKKEACLWISLKACIKTQISYFLFYLCRSFILQIYICFFFVRIIPSFLLNYIYGW